MFSMKRKLALIGVIVLILAASGGGLLWYLKSSESAPAKLTELSNAAQIDEAARTEYQAAQTAAAEAAAKAAAEQAAKDAAAKATQSKPKTTSGAGKVVTYTFATKGSPSSDFAEFKRQAAETLNDARGWIRAGVSFQEVASGGNFTLWLAQRDTVAGFSPSICSNNWSCSVGRNVIINDMNWANTTASWRGANASLRDYRHMVINHEVGHFLGHGHINSGCYSNPGPPAPVMQQQSMDLRSCAPNPWPLNSELWTNR
jgi:hypothetical protein